MAYLVSVTAWNINNVNFNLPFASGALTTSGAASALTSFGNLTVNGVLYPFATETRTISTEVNSDWAVGNNAQVLGSGITLDVNGMATGGTMNGLGLTLGDQFQYGITGFSLSALRLGTAQGTAATTDDVALVNVMLRGDDLAFLSAQADSFVSAGGDDVVFAGFDNDTISGGAGNDILLGEDGNDRLAGGIGRDVLIGGAGRDVLNGTDGIDTLVGGSGNDVQTGGAGRDFFVFGSNDGADTVRDFTTVDRLVITDPAIALGNVTVTQNGLNVTVAFGATSVVFENATAAWFNSVRVLTNDTTTVDSGISGILANWDYFV